MTRALWNIMNWIRHGIFYAGVLVGSFVWSWVFLMALLAPLRVMIWAARAWSVAVLVGARVCLGVNYQVRGWNHLPAKGPYIIACKHQSAWDTLIWNVLVHHPAFVLKASLLHVPIAGPCLRKLGMIPVLRGGADAQKGGMRKGGVSSWLSGVRTAAAQKRPIVIFPEGTRTNPGQTVAAYRRGIWVMAKELGIPVIPVALNAGVFWPRRHWRKRPGTITLEILPPMQPPFFDDIAFMNALHTAIETSSRALWLSTQNGAKPLGTQRSTP